MRLLPRQAHVQGEIFFANGGGTPRNLLNLSEDAMRQLRGTGLGMIFQEPMAALNPVMRVGDQIAEAVLAHQKVPRAEAWQRAVEGMRDVAIADPERRARDYPHQLSGGMRQRIMIAMAIVNRPRLLIADEPTTALDVTIQGQILYEMQKLTRETGTALIWITHDLSVIAGLADRVCVMYAGRIVEQGSTAEIIAAPGHPYTRGLLDSVPGNAPAREKLKQIPGMMPSLLDLPSGCPFRTRCPYATAECEQTPETRLFGTTGRTLRCFHPLQPESD
jgi:peptide/nickel transport system ATP-binding protein